MQALARAARVSPGAPYHHFPDKIALVAALATEGYELWLARARRSLARATTPRERLEALARSWLDFAAQHPAHYRVMLLPDIADRERFAELHATSGEGLALLLSIWGELLPRASEADRAARAVSAWSTLHGFAALRGAGVLGNIPGLPALEALERAAIDLAIGRPREI